MAGSIQKISFTSPYAAEEADIERRRRMAELLQAKGEEGLGPTQSVGGWAIRKSPWEALGKAAQQVSGAYQGQRAQELARQLQERRQADRGADMGALAAMLKGTPAQPGVDDPTAGYSPPVAARPGGQIDPAMLGQLRSPEMQNMAMQLWAQQMQPQKPVVVGRSLLDPSGKVIGVDQTWQAEQEAARKAKEAELQARMADARISREERAEAQRQLAEMQIQGRRDLAGIAAGLREPKQEQIINTAEGLMRLVNGQAVPITGPSGAPVKSAAGRGGQMTATAQKELIETEEQMQGGQSALDLFKQAKAINDKAMGGLGAGALATAGTLLPDFARPAAVDATQNLDNILQTAALPQLKAIFGGMPTEGERKILLDVQGSSSKPAKVRKEIFDRAEKAIQARLKFAQEKAKRLREGTYFSGEGPPSIQPPGDYAGPERRALGDEPPPGAVRRR